MTKKFFLSSVIVGAIVGLSSLASAQSTKGLWISGSADAFGVYRNTYSAGGFDSTNTYTTFGLAGSSVGIGYQFSEHFLFGGRFGFLVVNPDGGSSIFTGNATLHFQIPFLTGRTRPFVMFEPGLAGTTINGFGGANRQNAFIGRVGGGVHLFLTDSFSISPYGALGFQRLFDIDYTTVSFTVGALFSGWVWR
jgi:hypothetical protein